jgi:uncharacterized protein
MPVKSAQDSIIGSGLKFPVMVNSKGGLDSSSGPARVQDAIWLILSTFPDERLMRPNFGAGVQDFVFQPNSAVMRGRLANDIQHALTVWEPRIEVVQVSVTESPDQASTVLVSVDYRIRSTNELFNQVYPLYLQEGAG